MKKHSVWVLGAVIMLGVAGVVLTGCESTGTTDSAINVGTEVGRDPLTGEPLYSSKVTLSNRLDSIAFTARAASSNATLVLPLLWSVSDEALGTIRSSAAVTAIYESKGKVGNNIITVRDQGNSEGVAVVTQQ